MAKYESTQGNDKELENFSEAINIIRRRHLDTVPQVGVIMPSCSLALSEALWLSVSLALSLLAHVPQMAMAVVKLNTGDVSEGVSDTVQYFLDRLYINR